MKMHFKKPRATATLDVDRLYAKYKNKEAITLYTPQENITANVEIRYNDAGKPSAVILYGTYTSAEAINSMIDNLIKAKEKVGYRHTSSDKCILPKQEGFPDILQTSVQVEVYQKGSQYAKYGPSYPLLISVGLEGKHDFYFEVGDVRRLDSAKKEPFTF
jgi:hypothetical protein